MKKPQTLADMLREAKAAKQRRYMVRDIAAVWAFAFMVIVLTVALSEYVAYFRQ